MAHSLIREQAAMMSSLHGGTVKISVTRNVKTGEESHRIKIEYPPEEAMESLASRVRPLILAKEPIYCLKVLDALEQVVDTDALNEEIDLDWWREEWKNIIDGNGEAQAYIVGTASGQITDRKLTYAWIYGDLVHATTPRSLVIKDLSIDDRYHAAAPGIARICNLVITTHIMLVSLIDKGLLTIDSEVFSERVVVTKTSVDRKVEVYMAPAEGEDGPPPMPADPSQELDPTQWRTVHQVLNEAGLIGSDEIERVIEADAGDHPADDLTRRDYQPPVSPPGQSAGRYFTA
ncbi:hypothetical protein GCM10022238_33130 [Gordonia hankookensis]